MGFVWDLIQHSQISKQAGRTDTLESRIAALEYDLQQTNELLRTLLVRLEERFGEDIDGDGRVG